MEKQMSKWFGCTLLVILLVGRPAMAVQEKTIARDFDPVIVPCSHLTLFQGYSPSSVRVYAFDSALTAWEVIPYQVDERADYILIEQAPVPDYSYFYDDDNISLDGNDEVVFMVEDLGDRANPGVHPDTIPLIERDRYEVMVTDPLDGSHGWAYIYLSTASLSPVDYVDEFGDIGRHEVISETNGFFNRFTDYDVIPPNPASMTQLWITEGGGGDGTDFLDKQKSRAVFTQLIFTEDNMNTGTDMRYRDKPVREMVYFDNFFISGYVNLRSLSKYYHHLSVVDNEVLLPFPEGMDIEHIRYTLDFDGCDLDGLIFYTDAGGDGILKDHMDGRGDDFPDSLRLGMFAEVTHAAHGKVIAVQDTTPIYDAGVGRNNLLLFYDDSGGLESGIWEGSDTGDGNECGDEGIWVISPPNEDSVLIVTNTYFLPGDTLSRGTEFVEYFQNPIELEVCEGNCGVSVTSTPPGTGSLAGFALYPNRPNPSNPSTTIRFSIGGSLPVPISIRILNLRGQSVRRLAQGDYSPGTYSLLWGGKDDGGRSVASGIYLYRLEAGPYTATRKMVLLK
jgi:hypothetical protein